MIARPHAAPSRLGLFATGGTIAMRSLGAGQGIGLDSDAAMPGARARVPAGVTVEHHELFAKPSASITLADTQVLADRITAAFTAGLDGVVITHGTDTLEETAFALALLLPPTKPVILTGAMRAPAEPGADGPGNLSSALTLAASQAAFGLGPVVVFGDEIHAAHLVRKTHTSRPAAFSSAPFGPIGHVVEGRAVLELHSLWRPPTLRVVGPLPAVPMLQVGLDLEPETLEAFLHARVGGLVLAGVGGGHVSARAVEAIERLNAILPVIVTGGPGPALAQSYGYAGGEIDLARRGILSGGRFGARQARILLQLLLSAQADRAALRASFDA